MGDREPSESTEEFVPDFLDSTSDLELGGDVGISLFDRRTDDEPASVPAETAYPGAAPGGRRKAAVIASLVLLAVTAGIFTGYAAVQAAGGWEAIWVSSKGGTRTTDSSPGGASPAGAGQGSGSPSASSSASASASASGSGAPAPTATRGGGGSTYSPTPRPTWSTDSPAPSPTPTTSPPAPSPTRTKPHD